MNDIIIDTAGIVCFLREINMLKSTGPQALYPTVLHKCYEIVTRYSHMIFKSSFEAGLVPED